ncbi:hypothetical protein FKG94_22910 [Exilibacterium tricleocarpae]|uniref:Uncharacterized protein n=1 Tax=Exilibacterium tricleocarpae TaxID=2591008 RepID=A0A545SXG0_9GAMM|nr:hypothetical protein [Exilibacterium tricleocarpae]TQV69647.1 hypothetical protein FKG94_22910 [Exilibacterium tricleocarpae]
MKPYLPYGESKMLKSPLLIVSLLFFSGYISAAPGELMPVAKKIDSIMIQAGAVNPEALIVIEGGVPVTHIPSECNAPHNTVDLTTEHGKSVFSMALAARLAEKPVRLALSCTSNGDRPLIKNILL